MLAESEIEDELQKLRDLLETVESIRGLSLTNEQRHEIDSRINTLEWVLET
jgi:hypothetical protein